MTDLLDALTEEELQRLRDGEQIEVATRLREPAEWQDGPPTSFNSIKIQMTTTGTMKSLDDPSELADEFPDVANLDALIADWESDDA